MTMTVPEAALSTVDEPATAPAPPTASPPRTRWTRLAVVGLLLATAALYLWGLGASGWANSYYTAAAQAGTTSWKAFFFGSLDGSSSITVDKTPASVWLMALSVRVFGLNPWSVLVPQALAGVAAVGVLYAAVRRWFGPAAGLLAGAIMASTPAAALMFRFNNPDALLVLLLTAGAYAVVRAVERGSTRWLALAACCVGFGFLTKMLQAFLVVPAFAGAYLLAAPVRLRRRLGQLAIAGLALVASAGWWVAIVELTPARYRPYIGGSQHNSVLELTLGYNGLGRITGDETGSVGGGQGWGQTGWTRMFGIEIGGQVSWLLPAALILLAATLWLVRRAPRTDRTRAGMLLWGGWLLVTAAVFSFMQGIFHAYYTVALAPALGAVVGIGSVVLWRDRAQREDRSLREPQSQASYTGRPLALAALAAAAAATSVWSYVLLARSPGWHPWLRVAVLIAGLAAAAALLAMALSGAVRSRRPAVAVAGLALPATLALAAALAGPVAYSLNTAATAHAGAIPSAGPAVVGGRLGGPGGPPRLILVGPGPGPQGDAAPGGTGPGDATGGNAPQGGPLRGGPGGLLDASTPNAELLALLKQDSAAYTWVAAAVGANNAAGYQIASGNPVMAIGGFNGSDPSPTLAQFQEYVRQHRIHYLIGGSGPRGDSGSNTGAQIAAWVAQNFTATTVGGTTVYDLTQQAAAVQQ